MPSPTPRWKLCARVETVWKRVKTILASFRRNLGVIYNETYTNNNQDMLTKSSFFPSGNESDAIVNQISAGLSTCLVNSCDMSRDVQNCNTSCSLSLINRGDGSMSIQQAGSCLSSICGNTCGLPYADQDIYGVGILVSYVIQAIMVLILGLILILIAFWYNMKQRRQPDEKPNSLDRSVRRFVREFLSAQCYFGIFLQIAALCSKPDGIDPLNGYALLSVAMTGFLPTIFTLVLLQYHRIHSWYHTGLTFVSWLLASIVFFKLQSRLSGLDSNAEIEDAGLRRLYDLPSCGGSTALVLCKETVGSSPLGFLSLYYNYNGILNIRSMPVVWAWSTACLVAVVVAQLIRYRAPSKTRSGIWRLPGMLLHAVSHWTVLLLVSIVFGLCLGYQALMVEKYAQMDVIDWDNWAFGQIIAVTVWIPPVVEHLRKVINRAYNQSSSGGPVRYSPAQNTP
ncbi:hypothetical protein FE257_010957 [Aspergillus nanangensis]|uniref:Uncharacterized protein n=1 Tax=Aspergillus nanangensis TaxID=2582783 RepID=A0AAD4CVU0_ASPNN|nr:hypothetical protein FE257_010957 [Aspergillus nanangensis]